MTYHATMQDAKLVTAEELFHSGPEWCELIRGRVVELIPPGGRHGRIQASIAHRLTGFVLSAEIGTVYGEVGFVIERNPDTVRVPDVAFVEGGRLENVDETRYLPFAPDLAVEVVSPSDTFPYIEEKAAQWLAAGSRMVWVVEPESRRVFVYRNAEPREDLSESDTLDGGEVLPGFTTPVADCF
jgi:Uma2 family endonuclease